MRDDFDTIERFGAMLAEIGTVIRNQWLREPPEKPPSRKHNRFWCLAARGGRDCFFQYDRVPDRLDYCYFVSGIRREGNRIVCSGN